MKKLHLIFPILFCLSLLLFPSAALKGARVGISLWWERVFPALLPFLLCCSLMKKLGFLSLFSSSRRLRLLPVVIFGALSGYPAGAVMLSSYVEQGTLCSKEAQTMSYITNLCSPAFLMTILSLGLFENKRVFFPLLTAHILTLLIFALLIKLPSPAPLVTPPNVKLPEAITSSIGETMLQLLKIGGCIALCSVLSELLFSVLRVENPLLCAIIGGCIELTYGCNALLATALPLRYQLALAGFFTAFGGLSIALQSLCFLKMDSTPRYLFVKFLMGLCTGLVCYLITPLFLPDSLIPTFSLGKDELKNALTTGGILFCSAVSLSFILFLALLMKYGLKKAALPVGAVSKRQHSI
ncbi:MAG: hypothetical protein Q4C01_03275 [Clostridia bacterium]|nr:hypothetical protein [Clostridia bacterium]